MNAPEKSHEDGLRGVAADPLRAQLVGFLSGIGIEVELRTGDGASFLPGLDIRHGRILLNMAEWAHPGDILHEAGHIAVVSSEERAAERLSPTPGDEMTAIAWSYAAAVHLGIPAAILFHADGYRRGGPSLAENFEAGRYFGVPLLHYYGMAIEPRQAVPGGPLPYPHMLRWLR